MNLIFGMKVIYLMRLDSLVKIVAERCTRNTTKVPTVWNINYQIIKNNNTTTQKKASGCFSPMLFLLILKGTSGAYHHNAEHQTGVMIILLSQNKSKRKGTVIRRISPSCQV